MQPRLEHLVGYTVEEVGKTDDGGHSITFSNNTSIVTPRAPKNAKNFVGKRLTNVEYDDDGEGARLYFNDEQLGVKAGEVQLESFSGLADPFFKSDPNEGLPPDPSADRISDGPTDEEVRRDLERASQSQAGEAE